jgi:CheY-like chemotaxis protein
MIRIGSTGDDEDAAALVVLLAEDNPGDTYLIHAALSQDGIPFQLLVVEDGDAALAFLHGITARTRVPDVIVLDLNLPRHDGREILCMIRQTPGLQHVPVAVLTSSDSPRDREELLSMGASCYWRKPTNLDEFLGLGTQIVSLRKHTERRAGGGVAVRTSDPID